jgi:hypothetical protein
VSAPCRPATSTIETIVFNAFLFDDALIAWERSEGTRELPEGLAGHARLSATIQVLGFVRRLRPQGRQALRAESECGGHRVRVRRFRLSPSRFARRGFRGRLRGSPVAAR